MRRIIQLSMLLLGLQLAVMAQTTDSTDAQKDLKGLLDRGAITQEEYDRMSNPDYMPKTKKQRERERAEQRQTEGVKADGSHFGVRAGINLSFSNNTSPRSIFKRPKPGATMLIFYQYHRKKFVYMAELGLVQKGNMEVININNNVGGPIPGNQRIASITTVNYIELANLVGFRVNGFNFYGGITNGFNIRDVTWFRNTGFGNNNPSDRDDANLTNNYDGGLLFGLSKDIFVSKKIAIPIDLRFGFSYTAHNANNRFKVLSLSSGIKF